MHCVVYEITNGRPVPEVLAALSKDARVALAQPLQEFTPSAIRRRWAFLITTRCMTCRPIC